MRISEHYVWKLNNLVSVTLWELVVNTCEESLQSPARALVSWAAKDKKLVGSLWVRSQPYQGHLQGGTKIVRRHLRITLSNILTLDLYLLVMCFKKIWV